MRWRRELLRINKKLSMKPFYELPSFIHCHILSNSLHLVQKYNWTHCTCLRTLHVSVLRSKQFSGELTLENSELQRTDACHVQGQISGYILTSNGGYCVYYHSTVFRTHWEL